ncbi:hypothetical protein BSL78_10161 [Apostichopus japonicus]|uniref:MYND-type domain-containing protein n=1 Tax=Stichopus japonicus TaxID=307972 RepID=A0A2G8KY83_STIJA|nr:hypothetical protein BSL78_10161 [Apostichopus japonicus]
MLSSTSMVLRTSGSVMSKDAEIDEPIDWPITERRGHFISLGRENDRSPLQFDTKSANVRSTSQVSAWTNMICLQETERNGEVIDKRRSRPASDYSNVVKEFCEKEPMKESIRLLKAMLSRVTGGKEDLRSDKDTYEATVLTLGRDTQWKRNQVEIMRGLQKAMAISRLEGKIYGLQWCNFINRCIQGDILEVASFLLQLRLNESILEQDYFLNEKTLDFDPWDSVHFYALDVVANIVISAFWENQGAKRFLKKMITTGTFEKVLNLVEDSRSDRFLTTCMAVYVAANVCAQVNKAGSVNKGHSKICQHYHQKAHFIYKENAIKMAKEWFKNGVEKFEFDALAERPDGLSVMNSDGIFDKGCEEMSRRKTLESAINWAVSLQYHAIEYLAACCNPDVGYQDFVMREKGICKSLCRWMGTPIYNADICLMVQSSLRVLGQVGDSMSATWTVLAETNLIKHLELGMHYPNARALSLYLEVVTKLSRHRGSPRDHLINSDVFCQAAVRSLYSVEETVNVFALAFLQILAESDVGRFLTHFPPREIELFKEFFFDKTDSGLCISDLVTTCKRFDKKNSLMVTLYCNRAQCYLKDRQYQKAVHDCDIAVARCLGAAERLIDFDNELFKKAVYRRSVALFHLQDYERAALDVGECVILEQERKEFRAHMDKVVMMCRQRHGFEHIRKCIECDGAKGLPLKKCPNCPALYCSRVCQLDAWRNHHKANCTWFMNQKNPEID